MPDNRLFPRTTVNIPICIYDKNRNEISGLILNISEEGLYVKFDNATTENFKLYEQIEFVFADDIKLGQNHQTVLPFIINQNGIIRHINKNGIGLYTQSAEYSKYNMFKCCALLDQMRHTA